MTTANITSVPLLDLNLQYTPIKEEIKAIFDEVFESKRFILGPKIEELEERVSQYCNTTHAIGVSSGSDALIIALMALDIGYGDEVITTPFTFFATGGSIARVGAKPVFVDIDPNTFNLNPELIEEKITSKTKAIMPVHLFGQMADMDPLNTIAKKHNLYVIEDAAQAIGAKQNNIPAGAWGDIGCFSFFPSKNLGALGDGGMVTTNDPKLAQKLKQLRMHGETERYHHQYIGGNFRLDALQAAFLLVKLPHLDTEHQARQKNANYYKNTLSNAIQKPAILEKNTSIYNQYSIITQNRDSLINTLKAHNIGHAIYYPIPLHLQECFNYLNHKKGDFPVSEYVADHILSIPINGNLTKDELSYVSNAINSTT